MKYITLIIGLLVAAGCSKSLTEEEKKVVGSYEEKRHPAVQRHAEAMKAAGEYVADVDKLVFLDNRNMEWHFGDGFAPDITKWQVMNGQVHVDTHESFLEGFEGNSRYNIEPNGDLTYIRDSSGKIAEEYQRTYKRIK